MSDAPEFPAEAKKLRAGAEDFLKQQREHVDARRHHLDRVNRLLPEQAQSLTPMPDARGDSRPDSAPGGAELRFAKAGELQPAAVGDRDLEAPKSEAQKQAEAPPEIPRDKHGVPEFETPEAPAALTERNEHGIPEFKLREAPAPLRDEEEKEE